MKQTRQKLDIYNYDSVIQAPALYPYSRTQCTNKVSANQMSNFAFMYMSDPICASTSMASLSQINILDYFMTFVSGHPFASGRPSTTHYF